MSEDIEPIYSIIGRNIRTLRKHARLNQQVLADVLNLTRTSIVNVEAGRQRIPTHDLATLARFFHVPLAVILAECEVAESGTTDMIVTAMLRTRFKQSLEHLKQTIITIEEDLKEVDLPPS